MTEKSPAGSVRLRPYRLLFHDSRDLALPLGRPIRTTPVFASSRQPVRRRTDRPDRGGTAVVRAVLEHRAFYA